MSLGAVSERVRELSVTDTEINRELSSFSDGN
jgi:hypothetical protein